MVLSASSSSEEIDNYLFMNQQAVRTDEIRTREKGWLRTFESNLRQRKILSRTDTPSLQNSGAGDVIERSVTQHSVSKSVILIKYTKGDEVMNESQQDQFEKDTRLFLSDLFLLETSYGVVVYDVSLLSQEIITSEDKNALRVEILVIGVYDSPSEDEIPIKDYIDSFFSMYGDKFTQQIKKYETYFQDISEIIPVVTLEETDSSEPEHMYDDAQLWEMMYKSKMLMSILFIAITSLTFSCLGIIYYFKVQKDEETLDEFLNKDEKESDIADTLSTLSSEINSDYFSQQSSSIDTSSTTISDSTSIKSPMKNIAVIKPILKTSMNARWSNRKPGDNNNDKVEESPLKICHHLMDSTEKSSFSSLKQNIFRERAVNLSNVATDQELFDFGEDIQYSTMYSPQYDSKSTEEIRDNHESITNRSKTSSTASKSNGSCDEITSGSGFLLPRSKRFLIERSPSTHSDDTNQMERVKNIYLELQYETRQRNFQSSSRRRTKNRSRSRSRTRSTRSYASCPVNSDKLTTLSQEEDTIYSAPQVLQRYPPKSIIPSCADSICSSLTEETYPSKSGQRISEASSETNTTSFKSQQKDLATVEEEEDEDVKDAQAQSQPLSIIEKQCYSKVITNGKLGCTIVDSSKGPMIQSIDDDSPLKSENVQHGDIIIAFDGFETQGMSAAVIYGLVEKKKDAVKTLLIRKRNAET